MVLALPGAPTLVAPADTSTVTTATPTYQWSAATGAVTNYRLVVLNGAVEVLNALYTPTVAGCSGGGTCAVTPTTALTNAGYTWHVNAENVVGAGPLSATWSFTVSIATAPTTAATAIAPIGNIATTTPQYKWTPVPGATSYYLQVYDPTVGYRIQTVYAVGPGAGQVDCTTVPGECSITPAVTLNAVPNQWWRVQGRNSLGNGPFSNITSFTVN